MNAALKFLRFLGRMCLPPQPKTPSIPPRYRYSVDGKRILTMAYRASWVRQGYAA